MIKFKTVLHIYSIPNKSIKWDNNDSEDNKLLSRIIIKIEFLNKVIKIIDSFLSKLIYFFTLYLFLSILLFFMIIKKT